MSDFSPMMKQYFSIKEQYPNSILFFRLGDFYEMFFADALTASRELELTLTGRDCGQEEKAPMCGVPFHSSEAYIARLVAKGYKVAICEQVENPSETKGIVKREVVRVVTPGTVFESSMLDETKNNYICSLHLSETSVGLSFADVSTGELSCTDFKGDTPIAVLGFVQDQLLRFTPTEILINSESLSIKHLDSFIKDKLNSNLELLDDDMFSDPMAVLEPIFTSGYIMGLGIKETSVLASLAGLYRYLAETQKSDIKSISEIDYYTENATMKLDISARRNLELLETMRTREKKASLLWVLDKTNTAMGKRLIRSWVEQPLVNVPKILLRQNAVEELYKNRELSDNLADLLSKIFDIERIMTRIVYATANARELNSLGSAIKQLPLIKNVLASVNSRFLQMIFEEIDILEDIGTLIEASIVENPPFSIREGEIIKDGFNEELDSLRSDMNGGSALLADVEAREKESTGIPKLKVAYNRVFGYYIEVTNLYKDKVPDNYIRKQTLSNCERFITEELKILETRILGAKEKSITLEGIIYEEIRQTVAKELLRVQATAKAIAKLDVVNSLAVVALKNNYTKPTVNVSGRLYIKDGRHPVVENLLTDALFVPNDSDMDMQSGRLSVITGPNMAGKSTFMRQVAIIVIMAQMGSFVPASSAEVGIVDQIFTRVGASDDLSTGQSTFMVEMKEVADILKNATKDSLIILDEIGRGTSTFDGMSIARSVLEYIQNKRCIGAKTLFATHYHELTDLEDLLEGVRNFNIAVKKRGDDITFLRRIIRGGCDDSYGIQVAKLAGVPDKVVNRAKEVLKNLEEGEIIKTGKSAKTDELEQFSMETTDNLIMAKLRNTDVNTLTPIESMNILFELKKMLDN